MLKEVQAENARSGAWRRLLPNGDRRYKQFFEVDRYFNRLLREYDQPTDLAGQYRSVGNEKERLSLVKKEVLKAVSGTRNGYNSVN